MMPARVPKLRKPSEQLRRRNAPESWTVLPHDGCREPVPKWPGPGQPPALWGRLWRLPIACFWHELRLEPSIVATYVTLSQRKPEHACVLKLATELGLTPASMLRMRLAVEQPEPERKPKADPYSHLRAVAE
jgi:hypothetical protein